MMPSCKRVKLNRAALSNEAEPNAAAPRRRRLQQQSLSDCAAAPAKPDQFTPPKRKADSGRGGLQPAASFLPQKTGSGNVTGVRSHGEAGPSGLGGSVRESKPQEPDNTDVDGKPAVLSQSKGFLSKASESTYCHPFLEGKCSSRQWKHFGKQIIRVNSEGSPSGCKTQKKNAETGTSKTAVTNWYPKVILCDIAKRCDSCRCNCGCMSPSVIRTNSVHCLKKDMRARFQFSPEFFRHRHESSKEPLVKGGSSVQLNGDVGQCLTKHLNRGSDLQMTSNNSTSEESAVSGSVLTTGCHAGRDAEDGFGPRSVMIGAEIHKETRMKLEDRINPSRTFGSTAGENEERCDLSKACRTQKSSVHENDIVTDGPESFTCQRVRAYLRKKSFSCARAYMSWPFVNVLSTCDHPSARNDSDSKATHQPQPGTDGLSSLPLPFNEPATTSVVSTPSPSALGLSDKEMDPILSSSPSPFARSNPRSLSATLSSPPPPSFQLETVQGVALTAGETLCASLSSPPYCSDSSCADSGNSSSILPQDKLHPDGEPSKDGSSPKPAPFSHTISAACAEDSSVCCISDERSEVPDWKKLFLPPVLSPISSPQRDLWRRSFSRQSSGHSDAGTNEVAPHENETPHSCHTSQIASDNRKCSKDYFVKDAEDTEEVSSFKYRINSTREETRTSPSSDSEVGNSSEEERGDETDFEDDAERGNRSCENDPTDPKTKTSLPSGALTDPRSSPSSDDGSSTDEGSLRSAGGERSSPSIAGCEGAQIKEEAAGGGSQTGFLDEFTAYEQDILLIDVIQNDPELFDNLPEQNLMKLGPTRVRETPKFKLEPETKGLPADIEKTPTKCQQRCTPVTMNFLSETCDMTDEGNSRPWRPQYGVTRTKMQHDKHPVPDEQSESMGQSDDNNNYVIGTLKRSQAPLQTDGFPHKSPVFRAGPWITNSANTTDCRRPKSNAYCRQYFSESLSCGFRKCHFLHVPAEGDEKFCIETVARFAQNPSCIQKAGAVYTGYYQNNPPGVYFSMSVLLTLLWALLKAGMVTVVLSVLSVSLAHGILPSYDFLLALFNYVRENSLTVLVPQLMQLTLQMTSSGLDPSFSTLNCVKNTLGIQQAAPLTASTSGDDKLPSSVAVPEDLNLAHAIVEIELCIKQQDWRKLGVVFSSICQFSQHPHQVEQISGRVAVALLSESKDKLSQPFAAFVETVFQNGDKDGLINGFVGRIGVSLMLRYHKTHQWVKGRRVVEILSLSKVDYSTLRGLFGNEDRASRCCLITVATELFLMSGSVEGALGTLRENEWFLSSGSWPCDAADLEDRARVLSCLAEKTSHRDKLEVLCNLPGIKEPNGLLDVSKYSQLFNAHLQTCVDRQVLPVAADTVDFMLSKKLLVNGSLLQVILDKLGRQNHWLRAREIFRRSLSLGYYPEVSAPPGLMELTVPCRLCEVELVLAFEMFITVNAAPISHTADSPTLTITLKRTQSSESEYLSAGSRLLSAASIPQPKLMVHYKAVNSSQEQVFTLDCPSARRWLRSNHMWASDVWKQ